MNSAISKGRDDVYLRRVDYAADPQRPRRLDVLDLVIEEQDLIWRTTRRLDAGVKERRVRLAKTNRVGEHHRLEAREDIGEERGERSVVQVIGVAAKDQPH